MLGAFAVVVTVAAVTGTPELAPLAVAIGIPLVAGPVLAHRRARSALAGTDVHAHVDPASAEVGSPMEILVSVTDRRSHGGPLPPFGLAPVQGRWRRRGTGRAIAGRRRWLAPAAGDLVAVPAPLPGATVRCRLAVPTDRRGVFELPPQTGWVHDPLGLFGAPGPRLPTVTAVVYPAPVSPGQPVRWRSVSGAGIEAFADRGSGGGLGDLQGIRPYVPGDRLSLLHWPARARYGSWFVRHFDAEGASSLPLVVDDRAGVHRRADFDRLISAALWVVDETLDRGQAVALVTLSGRAFSFPPTDRGRADARLVLAELQPARTGESSRSLRAIPPDAVVLTTRTGADRLGPGRGSSGSTATPAVPATSVRDADSLVVL